MDMTFRDFYTRDWEPNGDEEKKKKFLPDMLKWGESWCRQYVGPVEWPVLLTLVGPEKALRATAYGYVKLEMHTELVNKALDAYKKAGSPKKRTQPAMIDGMGGMIVIPPITRELGRSVYTTCRCLLHSKDHTRVWRWGGATVDSHGECAVGSNKRTFHSCDVEKYGGGPIDKAFECYLKTLSEGRRRKLLLIPFPKARVWLSRNEVKDIWRACVGRVLLDKVLKIRREKWFAKYERDMRLKSETNHREAGQFFAAMKLTEKPVGRRAA